MNRKIVVALSLLAVLTFVGIYKGNVAGEGAAEPEKITYTAKNPDAAIGTAENPFTVLEIVPNEKMAAVGYLIPGCEPVDISTNTTAMGWYQTTYGDYDATTGQYGSEGVATVTTTVHNTFKTDFPSGLGYEATEQYMDSNSDAARLHFGQYGYFEHVEAGKGKYQYVPANGTVEGYFTKAENGGNYDWHALIDYQQTEGNVAPEGSIGTYYLIGNTFTDKTLDTAEQNNAYYSFEAGTSDKPFFGVPCVSDWESQMPENNMGLSLTKDDIGKDKDVLSSRYYQDRYEENYYYYTEFEISHKNQLIKTLFPTCEKPEEFVSQVVTVTPDQLKGKNVTDESNIIKDADMIVIHDSEVAIRVNTSSEKNPDLSFDKNFMNHDIDETCYNALIHRQASGNPAMMFLDESAMDDCKTNASFGAHSRNNVEKLYTVLNKFGAKYFYNVYCNSQETDADGNPLWTQEQVPDETAFAYIGHTMGGVYLGKAGYVLNFSDDSFLTKSVSDAATLSDDANVKVLDAMSEMYQTAHPNTLVNATEEDAATKIKTEINILEIEPIAQFIYGSQNWRSYYLAMMPDDFVGTSTNIADDIHVTTMATYEFNGKIEDLNSTYDMILIGVSQDETNGKNGYNDSALGNLAYTTVGDLVDTYEGDANFISTDRNIWASKETNRWKRGKPGRYDDRGFTLVSEQGSDIKQAYIRYSSTDITEKKYEELMAFSKMNPIIIDDNLYGDGKVKTSLIDTSSFIYEMAVAGIHDNNQYHIERRSNIINLVDKEKTVKQLLTTERCHMDFTEAEGIGGENGKPIEYKAVYQDKTVSWEGGSETLRSDKDEGVIGSVSNNDQMDEENHNVLRYHFTLRGIPGTTYGVKLFIDGNGNGSFEETECSQNLRIDGEKDASGNLIPGKTYLLTRILHSSESGIVPWKLEVYDVANSDVRDTEFGYTRVVNGQKKKIRVLQMNLSAEMSQDNATGIRLDDISTEEGAKFRAYLDSVEDYDVSIEFMNNTTFWNDYNGKLDEHKDDKKYKTKIEEAKTAWAKELQSYDMLVFGFDDGFDNVEAKDDGATFTDNVIFVYGFNEFVKTGKSVILSHDMVRDRSFSYPVSKNAAGYDWAEPEDFPSKMYQDAWKVDEATAAYLRSLSGQVNVYYSKESIDKEKRTVTGSTEYTYRNGEKISVLPDTNLAVGYLPDKDGFSLSLDPENLLRYKDYVEEIAGQEVTNLMDNSVRVMAFAGGTADSNTKTDRKIVDSGGAAMNASDQTWLDTCKTNTVRVANQGQITTYPFAIGETIDVGTTHAQNYKLNLDRDLVENAEGAFKIDGNFEEWEDVLKTTGSWDPNSQKKNYGCVVYKEGDKTAYGYAEVNEEGAANRNGGAFSGLEITLNGDPQYAYQVKIITVADDGTINLNPQMEGLAPGDYTFYLGSDSFSSTDFNNLVTNPWWNDDKIWGEMKMHITDGPDKVEFSLDVEAIKTWDTRNPFKGDLRNIIVRFYGISSDHETTPSYDSKDTEGYVPVPATTTTKTDNAIVWYNLSNDANDATNVYAAKEGDSANNYYIYTKGNVTYTGMGHNAPFKGEGNPAITNKEIRLFVNTLISAYRPPQQTPYLVCENEDALQNADVYTIYAEEFQGKVAGDVEVKLRAVDDSITQTQKTYEVTVIDEAGKKVDVYDNYKFKVTADALNDKNNKKRKTYTATLKTTYGDGRQVDHTITIRVMTMPLFGLD